MTDTARLRALLEAATPGPWTLEQYEHNSEELCGVQVSSAPGVLFDSLNAEWTMGCRMPPEDSESKWSEAGQHVHNLKLAAEAVNALPGLIEENERLRAALGDIRTLFNEDLHRSGSPEAAWQAICRASSIASRALNPPQEAKDNVRCLNPLFPGDPSTRASLTTASAWRPPMQRDEAIKALKRVARWDPEDPITEDGKKAAAWALAEIERLSLLTQPGLLESPRAQGRRLAAD
jgi:hypothetical protein